MKDNEHEMNSSPPSGARQSATLSAAKGALLAKWLRGDSVPIVASKERIPKRDGTGLLSLSFEQQRIWFFHQLEPASPLYNMPIAMKLSGVLHPELLQKALDVVVSRHE